MRFIDYLTECGDVSLDFVNGMNVARFNSDELKVEIMFTDFQSYLDGVLMIDPSRLAEYECRKTKGKRFDMYKYRFQRLKDDAGMKALSYRDYIRDMVYKALYD